MIILFTDYGTQSPYVGQVKAVLAEIATSQTVVDLLHEAPSFNPHAGAHLLAAWVMQFPAASVFLAVVDAGVGTERDAIILLADDRWYVGPDNGLLSVVAARAKLARYWRITWRPAVLSDSFHGRDLFAPIAAWIAAGKFPFDKVEDIDALQCQFSADDLPRIIYLDHFGNAFTGLRAPANPKNLKLRVNNRILSYARVYAEVPLGAPFWFANSVGLCEIAVNRGSAQQELGLAIGQSVMLENPAT